MKIDRRYLILPIGFFVPILLACVILGIGVAAEEKQEEAGGASTKESSEQPAAEAQEASRSELEKRFRETLTGATLTGRWRLVTDGRLGKEREEKYSIRAATKVSRDYWLITARIEYAGKDVTVPVPVKVVWAGDTPIITVTDLGIPGLGTYTARVMVYRDLYTGTWFGPGHGGLMSGSIVKTEVKEDGRDEKAVR